MSVFHPANVTSDGWEAPQTPQSHSPAINSCATDLIPRPSVPKSQVEVGWGCILSCMRTCCIGCISYVYSPLASSRLACHAIQHIQPIQPYSHTRHTSYSAIQPPSVFNPCMEIQHFALRSAPHITLCIWGTGGGGAGPEAFFFHFAQFFSPK